MSNENVKVSLYLNSMFLKPYIGYVTSDKPNTRHILAFIKRKAVDKMIKDSACFEKAVEAIWKKKKKREGEFWA